MATVMMNHGVRAQVVADDSHPFTAHARYDTADPLAVRLVFPAEASLVGAETAWTFSRALLADGLVRASGAGAVRLWPSGTDRVLLELQAAEGIAIVELAAGELRAFLKETYELLPVEAETAGLDMDQALADLLR